MNRDSEQCGRDNESARLEDFARASSGWFWEMDAQLRFSYMSPSVRDITGVAPEWHYGRTRGDIGIPDSVSEQEWRSHLQQLERREPFTNFVFKRNGPDGSKWMQTSGVPVFDGDGSFRGYRGIATDVSAQIEAERRARTLEEAIENLNDMFVLWDEDDRLVTCNARFRALNHAVAHTTVAGTRFEDHIRAAVDAGLYPEATGREEQWVRKRMTQHRRPGKPFVMQRQDGRWIVLSEQHLPDGSTATISTDITEQKRAERVLADQHQILETALRTIPDGVQVLDKALNLVAWNDQLFNVLDLDRDAILGTENPGEAFRYALAERGEYGAGDTQELVAARKAIARSTQPVTYERELVTGKWIECRGTPMEGGGYLAVYRNISESRKMREELERQATVDALTGLLNRGCFMERAEKEFLRSRRHELTLSMLIFDLDDFKLVNDRHGHAAGDEALRQTAAAARTLLRETDELGRIGGEEFSAVLPETDGAGAFVVAERMRRAIAELTIATVRGPISVTVSIGIAQLGADHGCAVDLLADADAALYGAKHAGRNRVHCQDLAARSLQLQGKRRPCLDGGGSARIGAD